LTDEIKNEAAQAEQPVEVAAVVVGDEYGVEAEAATSRERSASP